MADFNEYKGVWVFASSARAQLMSTDFELVSEEAASWLMSWAAKSPACWATTWMALPRSWAAMVPIRSWSATQPC